MNVLLSLLGFVPRWGWVALLAVVLASAGTYHAVSVHRARVEGRAEVQAKWDEEKRTIAEMTREIETQKRQANQEVDNAYVKRAKKAEAAASSAAGELERLRNEIARRAADTPAPAGTDEAASPAELLGRCAEAVVRMAAAADQATVVAQGLQDYARRVCVSK